MQAATRARFFCPPPARFERALAKLLAGPLSQRNPPSRRRQVDAPVHVEVSDDELAVAGSAELVRIIIDALPRCTRVIGSVDPARPATGGAPDVRGGERLVRRWSTE